MITFTKNPPEDCVLSEYMKGKAKCFFSVQLFGAEYWVPVTAALKRAFGITERSGKFHIDLKNGDLLESVAQDIVGAVYFEVRETLASEVERSIKNDISGQFERIFSSQLGTAVREGMRQRAIDQDPDVPEPV